jgi:hypothetical protein
MSNAGLKSCSICGQKVPPLRIEEEILCDYCGYPKAFAETEASHPLPRRRMCAGRAADQARRGLRKSSKERIRRRAEV